MVVVGVDGTRDGWIAVVLDDGGVVAAHRIERIGELGGLVTQADAIGIDIPQAFPRAGETIRPAEQAAARAALGPRRSSLFPTPPLDVLRADTHAEASARSVARTGKGISQQAYHLRAKVFEVLDWRARAPCPVLEVHPELSFVHLLGAPASASKKTWRGVVERRRALSATGIDLDDVPAEVGRVPPDDVLDAGAAAWSTRRFVGGEAVRYAAEGADPIWA